jgi:hypothetical protein
LFQILVLFEFLSNQRFNVMYKFLVRHLTQQVLTKQNSERDISNLECELECWILSLNWETLQCVRRERQGLCQYQIH